jgi:hypothetical protein
MIPSAGVSRLPSDPISPGPRDVLLMPDESRLRAQARAAVRDGKLPARAPDHTWGGPGIGAPCAVCDVPVAVEEMEFEIDFVLEGGAPGLDKYHVHIRCFAAWELERTKPV